jgi:hypothetical protein
MSTETAKSFKSTYPNLTDTRGAHHLLVVILEPKTMVSNNRDWWRAHLQRIEAEGLTTKAYADREGLVLAQGVSI